MQLTELLERDDAWLFWLAVGVAFLLLLMMAFYD
jgi:hypothetical protein